MDGIVVAFFVPLVIFLTIVAPIWIIMHYRSRNRMASDLSAGERVDLEEMVRVANRMAARIEALEAILDDESPDWRRQHAGVDGDAEPGQARR